MGTTLIGNFFLDPFFFYIEILGMQKQMFPLGINGLITIPDAGPPE